MTNYEPNQVAAPLTEEQIRDIENDQAKMPGATRENLTIRTVRAALIAQYGFCLDEDQCTCAREIGYRVCQPALAPTPSVQAEAVRVITAAARDVLAERERQISDEGWSTVHDDEHPSGDIAIAAACYAANAGGVPWSGDTPSFWPWCNDWWKPTTARRDLIKAGALILAEIERIDRAAPASSAGENS